MSGVKYFHDLPVYRLPAGDYYSARGKFIDETMYPKDNPYSDHTRDQHKKNPSTKVAFEDHLSRIYGGVWRYNEIIGYVRLHFLGSQIRGEYYGVGSKRIVRTRKKILEYKTWKLAPEIDIPSNSTNKQIFELVIKYVNSCRKELKKRYIDSELLEIIGQYVDWRRLWLE
jgi:hypothetical protein